MNEIQVHLKDIPKEKRIRCSSIFDCNTVSNMPKFLFYPLV